MPVRVKTIDGIEVTTLRDIADWLLNNDEFIRAIVNSLDGHVVHRDEFQKFVREMTAFREETRANFAQVDQRFEQVDQRFEHVDQRFEQVDQRFEHVENRLEGLTQEMRDLRTELTQEMRDLRHWVEIIGGGLQHRAGKNLENVVAGAFRLGLRRPEIQPEHVKLRQKITDVDGAVFKPGKSKEVDIIAYNDELLVFEVKSAPDNDDVDEFADKVALVRLQQPQKRVQGVFVTLGAEAEISQRCAELGLLLIPEPQPRRKK